MYLSQIIIPHTLNSCSVICKLLFSLPVVSNSLWPHGLQHNWPPCPSLSPKVCPSSCPLNWWCYSTISSSVTPFFFCLQSFPASQSFPMSWHFASGGQSIRASASVLLMNIQDWSPLGLSGLIPLQSKGLLRVFSKPQFKTTSSFVLSLLYSPTLTSIYVYWKDHNFDLSAK